PLPFNCVRDRAPPPPPLLPFPTRRSSDLPLVVMGLRWIGVNSIGECSHRWITRLALRRLWRVLLFEIPATRGSNEVVPSIIVGGDRESTRLDSSHQIISYAGRCLECRDME